MAGRRGLRHGAGFWLGVTLMLGLLLAWFTPALFGSGSALPDPSAVQAPHPEPVGHSDPFSPILLVLGLIILAAAFGRWLAGRFQQPSVLGELLIGMAVGNIGYQLGEPLFILIMHMDSVNRVFARLWTPNASVTEVVEGVFSAAEMQAGAAGDKMLTILTGPGAEQVVIMGLAVWLFSSLGVILLLFMVGLESSVDELLRVGTRAVLVAIVGVVVPFLLGLGAGMWPRSWQRPPCLADGRC